MLFLTAKILGNFLHNNRKLIPQNKTNKHKNKTKTKQNPSNMGMALKSGSGLLGYGCSKPKVARETV